MKIIADMMAVQTCHAILLLLAWPQSLCFQYSQRTVPGKAPDQRRLQLDGLNTAFSLTRDKLYIICGIWKKKVQQHVLVPPFFLITLL